MVIFKTPRLAINKLQFTCAFVQWLIKSSFVWFFFKDLFWPVNKPRFTCGFVLWLNTSFGQLINRGSLVFSCGG